MVFEITYYRNGTIYTRWLARGERAYMVGVADSYGQLWRPDSESVRESGPYITRKAVRRSRDWWQDKLCGDVMVMHLTRARDGAPMGTLIARPYAAAGEREAV